MKNVLIIEGSPRANGNSAVLCDEFARGAEEAGCSVKRIRAARKKSRDVSAATPVCATAAAVYKRMIWRR